MQEKKDLKTIAKLINDNEQRVEKLYKSACKKLNQERIKEELVVL